MPTQPEFDKPHPSTVRVEGHHPWCWNKPRPDRWPDVVRKFFADAEVEWVGDHLIPKRITVTYPNPMSTICHVGKNDNLKECEGCCNKIRVKP